MATGRVFAGTSGWAYNTWKPGFYPADVPARRFLQHYSTRLTTVEVNYTFRALPTAPQLAGWLAAAQPGFRFSFKAPEAITHRKRLRDCGEQVGAFLAAIQPARVFDAFGCVLFQLPPNFKADAQRLANFLALPQMEHAGRIAFEFRNESWFNDEIYTILRGHRAALCIAESEDLTTPEVQTAPDFACFRIRKDGGYTAAAVARHATRFAAVAQDRDVFVHYKHEDEPTGPLAAELLLKKLKRVR